MREVVLYIAMSLDGYIADKDYGVAWLDGSTAGTQNYNGIVDLVYRNR